MNTLFAPARTCALLLIVLSLSLSFAGNRTPDRDGDLSPTLIALERSKFSAQQQRDTASLNALLDEGLMWVDQYGSLSTKAAYLAALHNVRQTVDKITPQSMTVRTFATVAIVIGIYDETGVQDGHAFHRRCRFVDTWAWKKGKWVCIAATATSTIS